MNERLKELAVQAGLALTPNTNPISWFGLATDLERFAELVRADEREACAKLCDHWGHDLVEGNYAAKTIRARSKPDPSFKNYMGDKWSGIV